MRTAVGCRSLICLSWFAHSDRKADVKRERSDPGMFGYQHLYCLYVFLSSVKTESKTISHKKAQGTQKGKHQHIAYFAPFCGKYLILL